MGKSTFWMRASREPVDGVNRRPGRKENPPGRDGLKQN